MDSKQIVGLIGSIVVLIGCCMPIANNFIDSYVGYAFSPGAVPAGVALVAIGALGIYGSYLRSSVLLVVAATLGSLAFIFTLMIASGLLGEVEDFAELSINSISFRSGAAIIPAGLLIMLGSSLMVSGTAVKPGTKKHRSRTTRKSNLREDNIHRSELTRACDFKHRSAHRTSSTSIFKSGSDKRHRSGSRKRNSASR